MASPFIKIVSPDLPRPLFILLGEGAPTLSGGDGGFEEVARPRRKSFTEWTGQTALRIDIPLVIDGRKVTKKGVASVTNVESMIARLTRISRSSKDYTRPPIVRIFGPALPAQALRIRWVIAGLAWGSADNSAGGVRIRQEAILTLLEYVEPDLGLGKKKKGKAPSGAVAYRLVPVGTYRNLSTFATKHLGSADRWKEIASLNNIRSTLIPPRFVGRNLKVPRV